jgi:hypothetical protein
VSARPPLSTPLSQLLVAFTIELDNEFERRFAEAGIGRRFGISLVMWSNFLRFVGDGITVDGLPEAAGLPKNRMLSALGGMERWRYVAVGPETAEKRDGYGSARGLKSEWVVRPTEAGEKAREIWPPLFGEIEARWEERFGRGVVGELRKALHAIVGQLELDLPEYLPILASTNGMVAEVAERERRGAPPAQLSALLSQTLLAYTLDFERESELSLALSADFVRVLDETGIDVRELPAAAGVSKEATTMALKFLAKTGHLAVEAKVARLTPKGREAREAAPALHAGLERRWKSSRRLRAAAKAVLDQREALSAGLLPPPDGWRATKRYLEQTNAVVADPTGRLPHYPMVLPRGGWPDGS